MKKNNLSVKLTAFFFREDKDTIIASCPTLDISTCGSTLEEAKANFAELVDLFFEEAMNMGTLESILNNCGWRKDKSVYSEPTLIATELENIKIPCLS
jgi:predicted RNase H-like HicB family nuclease